MFYNFTYIKNEKKRFPGTFAVASLHMRANIALCHYSNMSLKCLAQGHYTFVVGFEPWTSCPGVRRSTAGPPRPHDEMETI